MNTCKTCRWLNPCYTSTTETVEQLAERAEKLEGYAGFCHRYPPTRQGEADEPDLPPAVIVDYYCGEWAYRPEKSPLDLQLEQIEANRARNT